MTTKRTTWQERRLALINCQHIGKLTRPEICEMLRITLPTMYNHIRRPVDGKKEIRPNQASEHAWRELVNTYVPKGGAK